MNLIPNSFTVAGVPFLAGLAALFIILKDPRKLSLLEIIVLSFGIGIGIVTIWGFLLMHLGFYVTIVNVAGHLLLLLSLILIAKAFILKGRRIERSPAISKYRKSRLELLLWALIIFEVVYVFWKTSILPINMDDAVSMWSIRAKIIYFAREVNFSFQQLISQFRTTRSADYPMLIPFAQSWVSMAIGRWHDGLNKMVSPVFFSLLVVGFYSVLKKTPSLSSGKKGNSIPEVTALLFTFLLAGLPFLRKMSTWGIADSAMTFYYVIGFLYMYLWMVRPEGNYLTISAFLLGMGTWAKNEGISSMFISALILAAYVMRNRHSLAKEQFRAVRNFFIIGAVFVCFAVYYKFLMAVPNQMINRRTLSIPYMLGRLDRLGVILYEFQKQFSGAFKKWNMVGYLFVAALVLNFKKIFRPPLVYIMAAIILNFILYAWIYVMTDLEIHVMMGTSQNRVLMHFIPFMVFISAILLASESIWKKTAK